jgi:hypothetical protein
MPIIKNIAEHDFSLPLNQDPESLKQRDGESRDQWEARLSKQEIRIPKKRPEKGDPGEPGYDAGGPGELRVTAEEYAAMKKHRVAKNWFGVNVAKGQGLIVETEEEEAPKSSKTKAA